MTVSITRCKYTGTTPVFHTSLLVPSLEIALLLWLLLLLLLLSLLLLLLLLLLWAVQLLVLPA